MIVLNGILAPSGGGGGGAGDVVGPTSSTDNAIARFDGTTGKLIQNSAVTIADTTGTITVPSGGNYVAGTGVAWTNSTINVSGTPAALWPNNGSGTEIPIRLRRSADELAATVADAAIGFGTAADGNHAILSVGNLFALRTANAGMTGLAASQIQLYDGAPGTRTTYASASFGSMGSWRVNSAGQFLFSSTTDAAGTPDTGLARSAAGVVKVTDGSTGIRGLLGGGTAVASATALPVPTGRVFHVTGTTTITSLTSTNFQAGAVITIIFDDVLTFTDGNNLVLAGDFTTSANDTITLAYDGTNWYEVCRSVN